MSIDRYRTFVVAARSQTFFKAADELYITPATVSKHIAALEKELGVVLFERTPQGVSLSKEGKKRLPLMQKLVAAYDALMEDAGSQEKHQRLTVVVSPPPSRFCIEKIVRGFSRTESDISLRIQEIRGATDAILSGECELAFLNSAHLDSRQLQWITIQHTPFGVVLPSDHPLAKCESISLRDLREDKFVLPSPELGVLSSYIDMCHRCGFAPQISYYGYREDSILFYVSCGEGVAFMTKEMYGRFNYDNTVFVPLDEKFYSTGVLAKSRSRVLSSQASVFWNYVKRNFGIKIE